MVQKMTITVRPAASLIIHLMSASAMTIYSTATNTSGSLQVSAINLTNKTALYNFLSTFSGTHFVTPRSHKAELGFHF